MLIEKDKKYILGDNLTLTVSTSDLYSNTVTGLLDNNGLTSSETFIYDDLREKILANAELDFIIPIIGVGDVYEHNDKAIEIVNVSIADSRLLGCLLQDERGFRQYVTMEEFENYTGVVPFQFIKDKLPPIDTVFLMAQEFEFKKILITDIQHNQIRFKYADGNDMIFTITFENAKNYIYYPFIIE